MTSLREQLAGGDGSIPEFRLMLPEGWSLRDVSAQTEQELLDKAKARLREAQRPDTYALLAAHTKQALATAREQGAFAMITPGEEAPRWAFVPISVLVSMREGTPAVTLDQMVADAVENRGARALHGSKHFLRWAEQHTVELSGDTAGTHVVVYLTPVPGSRHRRALQFTVTLAHPVDTDPLADADMSAWLDLLDSHMLTFSWTGR